MSLLKEGEKPKQGELVWLHNRYIDGGSNIRINCGSFSSECGYSQPFYTRRHNICFVALCYLPDENDQVVVSKCGRNDII